MDQYTLNLLIVGATFALYLGIAFWSRASSTAEFYAAGRGVHPVTNGMATAADWMSAASFISMAGIIAFAGYSASAYLMGWTGGYVLLAMLLAPYLLGVTGLVARGYNYGAWDGGGGLTAMVRAWGMDAESAPDGLAALDVVVLARAAHS